MPLSEFLRLRRQRLRPLSEYLWDVPTKREDVDRLGIEVEDAIDRFEGHDVFGVEVLNVRQSSPGALAGLRSRKAVVSTVLKTITLVGTLVFVPTRFIYDWVSETGAGDWHDLIIGVDGERVQYVSELENALGQVKEGDIVYLTLLRSGKRVQVPVSLETLGSK
jgi:S1-C subfamily serine protease